MLQLPTRKILSRSHMLRMVMLSQRAVDYSIKAYVLNSSELCRQVTALGRDLSKLELCVGDRGRAFVATGVPFDSHSPFACSSLRIYSSLRVMFTAANEIAQNMMVIAASTRKTTFPQTVEVGNFVNGLVRLCAVALFEEQMLLAKTALQLEGGRRRFDLAMYRAQLDLLRRSDTHCKCELAIANCIGQIAEQAYEIAEDVIAWLLSSRCGTAAGANTANVLRTRQRRLSSEQFVDLNRKPALTLQ
jgi:hypothetical protein